MPASAPLLQRIALITVAAATLAACATVEPGRSGGARVTAGGARVGPAYQVNGTWYTPREDPDYDRVGMASWYGEAFQGRATADGEVFDLNAVSGAHTTLPLPSVVEVTNLDNGRRLRVRINDRGPFVDGRIIDLSREAARQLGFDRAGLARVRVRYVGPAPLLGPEAGVRIASAAPRPAPAAPRAPRRTPAPARPQDAPEQLAFASAPAPAPLRRIEVLPSMPPPAAAPVAASPPEPSAASPGLFRIQAGAFGEEQRARSVAGQLSAVAPAVVEPVIRDGQTLYRVILQGPADELQAWGLRQRVAEAGFAEARVIRPF